MSSESEHVIPQHHVELCRALCRVAAKHGVNDMTVQFRPGFGDPWRDTIVMSWTQGRHGADVDRMKMTSTVNVDTTITDQLPFEKGEGNS